MSSASSALLSTNSSQKKRYTPSGNQRFSHSLSSRNLWPKNSSFYEVEAQTYNEQVQRYKNRLEKETDPKEQEFFAEELKHAIKKRNNALQNIQVLSDMGNYTSNNFEENFIKYGGKRRKTRKQKKSKKKTRRYKRKTNRK